MEFHKEQSDLGCEGGIEGKKSSQDAIAETEEDQECVGLNMCLNACLVRLMIAFGLCIDRWKESKRYLLHLRIHQHGVFKKTIVLPCKYRNILFYIKVPALDGLL